MSKSFVPVLICKTYASVWLTISSFNRSKKLECGVFRVVFVALSKTTTKTANVCIMTHKVTVWYIMHVLI